MELGRGGPDRTFLKPGGSHRKNHRDYFDRRPVFKTISWFLLIILASLILTNFTDSPIWSKDSDTHFKTSRQNLASVKEYDDLDKVLRAAAMEGSKTVIITTVNSAWMEHGSIFDLFMESFTIGNQTWSLLNHLVVVALDHKAYTRCLQIHIHCIPIPPQGTDLSKTTHFMSTEYMKMVWRRIGFLGAVLEMGYDFIFTDADILWLRNPFPRFHAKGDADLQFACDLYKLNSTDLNNLPNGGFMYAVSNNRTIQFFKFWNNARDYFPGKNEQEVFNLVKFYPIISRIGLQIRFLNTDYFGGLCQSRHDLDLVITVHANCCVVLGNKIHDLKLVMKEWNEYMSLASDDVRNRKNSSTGSRSWAGSLRCGMKRKQVLNG